MFQQALAQQGAMGPQQAQLQQALAQQGAMGAMMPPGMAKGGKVRTFDSTKAAPGNLATHPGKGKFAKGGVLRRKPPKKVEAKRQAPQPPPDEDVGPAPSLASAPVIPAAPAGPPPAPIGPPPGMAEGGEVHGKNCKCEECAKRIGGAIKKAKGGECDKMAAGGVAKVRRGFPNTNKAPGRMKRFAKGGAVRGSGAATKGTRFSGIF
jgi:hypothetical protein